MAQTMTFPEPPAPRQTLVSWTWQPANTLIQNRPGRSKGSSTEITAMLGTAGSRPKATERDQVWSPEWRSVVTVATLVRSVTDGAGGSAGGALYCATEIAAEVCSGEGSSYLVEVTVLVARADFRARGIVVRRVVCSSS